MFTCKFILTFKILVFHNYTGVTIKSFNEIKLEVYALYSNYLLVLVVCNTYEFFSSYQEKGFMLEAKSFVPKKRPKISYMFTFASNEEV